LPYLLFAYREVPQASTGFSPFELLYDQQVWGPLDVLKETCETDKRSNEIVVSYVLSVQEKLARMSEMMTTKLVKAQNDQKRWYDHPCTATSMFLPYSTRNCRSGSRVPILCHVGAITYV